MKNIIVSNLAPITENDLTFFMELEKSLNSLDYKVYFWSCIQVPEFKNYIQMAWDITKWERFGEKLSQKQKEIAHYLVDKDKWYPRVSKLVKQGSDDIEYLYNTIVYNSYYLLINNDISIFFSWNNLCPHSGILNDMCNQKNIETFLIERGNFPNTWYLEKGGLLGHSMIARSSLKELNIPLEYYEIGKKFIDNLKFDKNDKYKQNRDENIFKQLQLLKEKATNEAKSIIIMFPPDDGTVGFFPCEHNDRIMTLPYYKNSFDAAKEIARHSDDIIIFKPHPSFIGWEYDFENLNNIFVIDYDFKYLIQYADIIASSGSGLGLISLANKKPLLSVSIDILYNKSIAYEAIHPKNIKESIRNAKLLVDFNIKIDKLYLFIGYLMKEYMISLSKEDLNTANNFVSKNINQSQTMLKRFFNAIFK